MGMEKHWIQNFESLASTTPRRDALEILEAGYDAINTTRVVERNIHITDTTLTVCGENYQFDQYENIFLIGFGKGSCSAVFEIYSILTTHIKKGVVIDRSILNTCPVDIEAFAGTHPLPSEANVKATLVLEDIAQKAGEKDLVLVVVAGGGSSLLCSSSDECDQNTLLFEECERVGATIAELNLVRKHISTLKGGGLARVLYPATVVGLIFSDIVGGNPDEVASGPTYYDASTCNDALAVLKHYNIAEKFHLNETPKETKFFDRVHNYVVVSNEVSIEAMATKAREKGYAGVIIKEPVYDTPQEVFEKLSSHHAPGTVVFAGGEIRYPIPEDHGEGGRCQFLALESLDVLGAGDVLIAAASDGRDNSDKAGAITDGTTLSHAKDLGIDIETSRVRCDTIPVFEKTGDEIITGPTQANVSDWYFLLVAHK